MANKCYNLVSFFGSEAAMKEIHQLFEQLKQADIAKDASLVPNMSLDPLEYWMFDINVCSREFYTLITYDTNWHPNMRDITRLAVRLDITVMHDYEDPEVSLYGKYIFTPGRFVQSVRLDYPDLGLISYDEDTDEYCYKDYSSQCLGDMADIILMEKISRIPLSSP
ncbi:DUF1281 family ferredoxin-like fold protein [Pedobacter hiemivivus]|uniref:YubB ferredoxin-like domain-containing protein n=1 Tax=Pedobacter hiemivivus TaxID=2530454 RepID=A0A4R0NEE4_9SPHI|nr:hypothetical protein [Pedobacter hiemivivus]TCC98800.1 hypothetical protein EZ444_05865 [Pedobacter hiemivivus]